MDSFLAELRGVRDKILAQSTKTLNVPGAGGKVAVRFRPPSRDKLTPYISAYKNDGALTNELELQLIIDCCDEIVTFDADSGEYVPADPDGGPLRFDSGDERWGDDVRTARECVAKLYMLDLQPLAAAGHADAIFDWLQGLDAEVAVRLEQEGKAGTPASS